MLPVMQLTLCVHVEQNNSSCVLKILRKLIQIFSIKVNTLLYGSYANYSKFANQEILKFVIAYIKATTRFHRSSISSL